MLCMEMQMKGKHLSKVREIQDVESDKKRMWNSIHRSWTVLSELRDMNLQNKYLNTS